MNLTGNSTVDSAIGIGTAVVTLASILANIIPPYTIVGRGCHWLALNGGWLLGRFTK